MDPADTHARRFAIIALLAAANAAFAGRPLTTEDASVLDERHCQVEAWVDRTRDSTVGWFVPACNFGAGIEWQAGWSRSDHYYQAKTVFGESGLGLVVGANRKDPYAIVPLTVAVDKVLLHFNAGWSRDREARRNVTLWAIAAEVPITETVTAVAEAFGENSERPFLRAGGRWNVTETIALDLTWVVRPGGTREERFVSLGVYVELPWTSRR